MDIRQRYLTYLLAVILSGCTDGRQPIINGEIPVPIPVLDSDNQQGRKIHEKLTRKFKLASPNDKQRVSNLVTRLSQAAGARPSQWHVEVFQADNLQNAAATAGNYLFVWTGLLKLAKNDDEIAVIVAHEMGHILAQHHREFAVCYVQTASVSPGDHPGIAQAYSVIIDDEAEQSCELEADMIGLNLMAQAGYDPLAAIEFWQRLLNTHSREEIEYRARHTSTKERLENIKRNLVQAQERYNLYWTKVE